MANFVVGIGEMEADTAALSVDWPPHLTGDIGILLVQSANEPVATPTDWTAIESQGSGTGGSAGSVAIQAFWKRAASAAEAAVTVADAGNHTIAAIWTVAGCLA